ncbi:MAG: FAD-dependent oxidoreductase, partial [Deltaproteobacteria bacterium]|nr:FAD-dependent oxidoreductase [Deltaproteobacteria bacterium]
MPAEKYDLAVIGGGIIGLSTAMQFAEKSPETKIVVLEKEPDLAMHQSGHNSGVIHSGIYYRPGSAKARMCVSGKKALLEFCDQQGIRY